MSNQLKTLVLLGALSALLIALGPDFLTGALGAGPNPLQALLLVLVAPLAATILQLGISRSREFEADRAKAALSGDPEALARALEKSLPPTRRRRSGSADSAPWRRAGETASVLQARREARKPWAVDAASLRAGTLTRWRYLEAARARRLALVGRKALLLDSYKVPVPVSGGGLLSGSVVVLLSAPASAAASQAVP